MFQSFFAPIYNCPAPWTAQGMGSTFLYSCLYSLQKIAEPIVAAFMPKQLSPPLPKNLASRL
jgi:hypothetical protein